MNKIFKRGPKKRGSGYRLHNITKDVHDGLFPKEETVIRTNYVNLQLLVEKFRVHNRCKLT